MNLRDFPNRLFDFDAHYPRTIIAGVIFITVILGWKVFNLELDPGLKSMLPRDHDIVHSMEKENGNKTIMKFKNYQRNVGLKDDIFSESFLIKF